MKYLILAAAFIVTATLIQSAANPVQAQSAEEIRRICWNKHNLGKYASSASEAQRKENEARRQACIRSGGKS
jgi:hypothetical protein